MEEKYYTNYPTEPIGGGNPYYRCVYCKISDPQINGRLEGHRDNCEWANQQRKETSFKDEIEKMRLWLDRKIKDECEINGCSTLFYRLCEAKDKLGDVQLFL